MDLRIVNIFVPWQCSGYVILYCQPRYNDLELRVAVSFPSPIQHVSLWVKICCLYYLWPSTSLEVKAYWCASSLFSAHHLIFAPIFIAVMYSIYCSSCLTPPMPLQLYLHVWPFNATEHAVQPIFLKADVTPVTGHSVFSHSWPNSSHLEIKACFTLYVSAHAAQRWRLDVHFTQTKATWKQPLSPSSPKATSLWRHIFNCTLWQHRSHASSFFPPSSCPTDCYWHAGMWPSMLPSFPNACCWKMKAYFLWSKPTSDHWKGKSSPTFCSHDTP